MTERLGNGQGQLLSTQEYPSPGFLLGIAKSPSWILWADPRLNWTLMVWAGWHDSGAAM